MSRSYDPLTRRRSTGLVVILCAGACMTPSAPSPQSGCGTDYPAPEASPYTLPFPVGESHTLGLGNCAGSFHGPSTPDRYAFDFDLPQGSDFVAARAGVVAKVVEDAPSGGGGVGNYVLIDHEDGTLGYYLHSPRNGVHVEEGERVEAGQPLGQVGRSGLAGYPHLHFTVVLGDPAWPYTGVPTSFRNADPADRPLRSYTRYRALPR